MNNNLLKENKVHGDTIFPLATYSMKYVKENCVVDCHWHSEFEFLMVKSGKINFKLGLGEVTVNTGEALFINSGELHAGYNDDETECEFHAIVFSPGLLYNENLYDPINEKYIEPLVNGSYTLPRLFCCSQEWQKNVLSQLNIIYEEACEKKFGYEMSVKGRLLSIFSMIFSKYDGSKIKSNYEKNDISSERIKKVMEYIYDNYSTKILIRELAQELNMSEGHFIRFFKTMVRKTPIEYINYYRINKAALLLEDNSKKIIEISCDVGFENVSYFVSTFKHFMQCTPSEFRKKLLI